IRFDPASFKDPSGRVFYHGDSVYRTLTPAALDVFRRAERIGLVPSLVAHHLLVDGAIVKASEAGVVEPGIGEFVLKQRKVAFVSYSCEWSFEMLRAAALTTLRILERALAQDFVLKDAPSFNVLFDGLRPVLVDSASLEPYEEGQIWTGYSQFCRSFLF